MTDVTYDQLVESRNAAMSEMNGCTSSLKGMAEKLQEGVSLKEACEIVDRFWPTREAGDLKTRLFSSFPKENGQVLLNKGLDKRIVENIAVDITRAYFHNISEYVAFKVEESLNHINGLGLDNSAAADAINELRKQVARYLGYINWGVYEIKTQLLGKNVDWEELSPSVDGVENGDYLFLENLPLLTEQAHDRYVEENLPQKYGFALSDIEWRFGSLEAVMELSLLFAKYLHEFESKIGNKEVVS